MNVEYTINTPESFVFEHLANMQKFVSVHPVITKIEKIEGKKFRVFETLKSGVIRYSFTYTATVESNKEIRTVNIKARIMKLTSIEMAFSIAEVNGFSIIKEEINFKTVLPVKSLMQKLFMKQHKQLFINIEKAYLRVDYLL